MVTLIMDVCGEEVGGWGSLTTQADLTGAFERQSESRTRTEDETFLIRSRV